MWYAGAVEALFEATATGRTMAKGRSLSQFQEAFPDEASCAAFLSERRWPEGFVCPGCGEQRAAALKSRAYTYECLDCGRQTSATAGTVMHRSKLPLTTWFWAAHLMATHSNGMSARQLEDQLGVTYKTAWLLTQKLRRSMVDPDRDPLEGVVEVDQAEIPFREGDAFFEPGNAGKILVAGGVEVIDRDTNQPKPRRKHAKYLDTRIVGKMAGHVVLPWIHRAFSLMKRWGLGTYHGLRRTHVDTYLNEFVFRYNRRFHRHVSFEALLGLAAHHAPASYWDIVQRDNPRKGVQTIRRTPRRRKTATGMRQDGAPSALGGDQNQPIKPVQRLPIVEPGTTG